MNHLAHLHLAWPDPGLLCGAIEGDYRKGPVSQSLPKPLALGVRLHRRIDAFTDSDEALGGLRNRFPPPLRRYAGILLDLAFDHFLALHWTQFHADMLEDFAEQSLDILERESHQLDARSQHTIRGFREHGVLLRYREWDMIAGSASRVGERLKRGNALRDTDASLRALRPDMEAAFLAFYPRLMGEVRRWRALAAPEPTAV